MQGGSGCPEPPLFVSYGRGEDVRPAGVQVASDVPAVGRAVCFVRAGDGWDAGAEPVPAESNQALWAGTLSSMEAPDHWLMERRSRSSRLPSKSMRMSSGKGRVASMSLPAGSVWGMM